MSASNNLQPRQLAMFMPAKDLYHMHSLDARGGGTEDMEDMRDYKRMENREKGMRHSILKEGIRHPVQIAHRHSSEEPRQQWDSLMSGAQMAVANGNHRVIAAYDADPDMEVPVIHHDNVKDMRRHQEPQDED